MNLKRTLEQRIRGWLPQEPKLDVNIQYNGSPIKTPELLVKNIKEIRKPVLESIGIINFGVFIVLQALYSYALNDSYFYLNAVENTIVLAAVFGVCSFLIILGSLGLKIYKDAISFTGKLKFLEIIPNATGYALMGIGIYFASFCVSRPLPNSVPDFYSWHPYTTQGFDLYITGLGVLMATILLYNYLIPKQIASRLSNKSAHI